MAGGRVEQKPQESISGWPFPALFHRWGQSKEESGFILNALPWGSYHSVLSRVILRFRISFWFFFFRVILREQIFFFFEAPETVHGQPHLSLFLGIKTCPGKKHSKGSERSTKASKVECAMLSLGSVIWGMGGQHTQDEVCLLLRHRAQPLSWTVATFFPHEMVRKRASWIFFSTFWNRISLDCPGLLWMYNPPALVPES